MGFRLLFAKARKHASSADHREEYFANLETFLSVGILIAALMLSIAFSVHAAATPSTHYAFIFRHFFTGASDFREFVMGELEKSAAEPHTDVDLTFKIDGRDLRDTIKKCTAISWCTWGAPECKASWDPTAEENALLCLAAMEYVRPLIPENKVKAWITWHSTGRNSSETVKSLMNHSMDGPIANEKLAVYALTCLFTGLMGYLFIYGYLVATPARFDSTFFWWLFALVIFPVNQLSTVATAAGTVLFFISHQNNIMSDVFLYNLRKQALAVDPFFALMLPSLAFMGVVMSVGVTLAFCCMLCKRQDPPEAAEAEETSTI